MRRVAALELREMKPDFRKHLQQIDVHSNIVTLVDFF